MSNALHFKFRTGSPRPAWTPPKASGRFAFLEMSDRQALRAKRTQPTKRPLDLDAHHTPSVPLLEAWAPVEDRLRESIDGPTFRLWLADLHPHRKLGGRWYLAARSQAVGWVRDRFGRLIESCAGCPCEFVACSREEQ